MNLDSVDPLEQNQALESSVDTRRRASGLATGALMGLGYGLASQAVNVLYLPGLPLAHAPFGQAGNVLAAVLGGALAGLVCAWPRSGLNGVMGGTLALIVLLELNACLAETLPLRRLAAAAFAPEAVYAIVFAGLVALPLLLLLRWALERRGRRQEASLGRWKRLWPSLSVVALAGVLGIFVLYPPGVRHSLEATQAVIQKGLGAATEAELPMPLQPAYGVEGFLEEASQAYTLYVSRENLLAHYYSFFEAAESATIQARFASGYRVTCTFLGQINLPQCSAWNPGE